MLPWTHPVLHSSIGTGQALSYELGEAPIGLIVCPNPDSSTVYVAESPSRCWTSLQTTRLPVLLCAGPPRNHQVAVQPVQLTGFSCAQAGYTAKQQDCRNFRVACVRLSAPEDHLKGQAILEGICA